MGKVRSRKGKGKARDRPTGLPSVKEAEQQIALEGGGATEEVQGAPILGKLASSNASERESTCRSLAHLVQEDGVVGTLMEQQLVKNLAPLMVDTEACVREAATGALRNLSVAIEGSMCEAMVEQGVAAPLCKMLKDCVTELQTLKIEPQGTGKVDAEGRGGGDSGECAGGSQEATAGGGREEMVGIADQGLNLLLNLSEQSSAMVDMFNSEQLLPLVLHLLNRDRYPPSLVTSAAQCLHTVTENNPAAALALSSSQEHLSFLEGFLASSANPPTGLCLLLKTSIAGVFSNLLPSLPAPLHSPILRGVLSVLGTVLDTDVSPLLHALASTPPPTPPQHSLSGVSAAPKKDDLLEDVFHSLGAIRVALEVLANVCYVEKEEEEGGGWEDEEEEEMVGDMEADCGTEQVAQTVTPNTEPLDPRLSAVVELGIHHKVYRKCLHQDATLSQLCSSMEDGERLLKSLAMVRSRSLVALQNLVAALPVEAWEPAGTNVATIASSLFSLLESGSPLVSHDALLGALLAVAEKMRGGGGEAQCVSLAQLERVAQVGLTAGPPSVRADVMSLLGTVGKLALQRSPVSEDILTVIGCSLRDSIARDGSLWVVSQALDSVFDVFGDDNCPLTVFTSVGLMAVLRGTMSTMKARLRVERKSLQGTVTMAVVECARTNLPRFVDYMTTRTK